MGEDICNKKRKKILNDLDQGKKVSIMELGMYDLTPYFNLDDFDMNLSESIMLNKNYSRKIGHVKEELYFSPPQFKALNCLYEKDRVIISAPTSFGKTLLVKEYIFQKKLLYIFQNQKFTKIYIFRTGEFKNTESRMGSTIFFEPI